MLYVGQVSMLRYMSNTSQHTIATVVVPMFNSEEATPEETQRRARNIETVKGYVFQGLAKAAELYGQ